VADPGARRASVTTLLPAGETAAEASADAAPPVPRHVAIIMDGNRRWARARGLPEMEGHAAGVDAIRPIVRHAAARGIEVLSLYAFSRENWARSEEEVSGLFAILERAIRRETDDLIAEGVEVRLLGRVQELPPRTRQSIGQALERTAGGPRLVLNVAFNYSGRSEIVDALRRLVAAGADAGQIDEEAISAALDTAGLPDPDLVIRTGGEQRLSNFLIWQSAYAELYSSPALWPDFDPQALDDALLEYASRVRRFGR
jgi:undecaprenyl diphosphate synthase